MTEIGSLAAPAYHCSTTRPCALHSHSISAARELRTGLTGVHNRLPGDASPTEESSRPRDVEGKMESVKAPLWFQWPGRFSGWKKGKAHRESKVMLVRDDSKDVGYTASYPNQPFLQFLPKLASRSLFLSFPPSSAPLTVPLHTAAPFDLHFCFITWVLISFPHAATASDQPPILPQSFRKTPESLNWCLVLEVGLVEYSMAPGLSLEAQWSFTFSSFTHQSVEFDICICPKCLFQFWRMGRVHVVILYWNWYL